MGSLRLHPNESAHPAPPATREDNRGSEPATSQEVNADGGQQGRPPPPQHDATPAVAVSAMVELLHPLPANSVPGAIRSWFPGKYHHACVERARATGDPIAVLIAERVVSAAATAATAGTAATVDPPGMVLGRVLGEGGSGCVRMVSMPDLGFTGAMKTLKAGGDGDMSRAIGFGRMGLFAEMDVLIRMPDHPHINQALGINDTDQNNFWLVYPLADGDLLEDIAKRTKMVESEVMRLVIEGGTGASCMHDNGYVHNDIKAENILVFSSGPGTKTTGKIADLGLARAIGDMRRGGTLGGTPPEAMQGRQVPCHPSQDVFAFAHMVLVLVAKVECKFANMFASQLCMTADDKRRLVAMDAESARIYIEYMTIRNLTEPSFRGAVLNPSIVSAQFQHMSHELIQLIDPALAVNPSERPSMQQLLRGMIGLYGRQLKFEKTSSAAVAPAAAEPVSGAPSATDALAVGAIAALPGVVGLSAEEAAAGDAASAAVSATVAAAAIPASHARYAGDVPPTLPVAKENAAPKDTARVRRLPPGLFGGVGSVGGGGGDCGAEDGGTASGGIFPTPAVATADTAPYGTATVQRLPPGLLVADSGGASLPAPTPAATAAAITTTTASAATVITATATVIVDRGNGAVRYPRSEGNTTTPAVTSGAIGKGAGDSYDASGGGNGGGAHADGYAVQGPAPEPAMERVTKGSTARINAVYGWTAASETATGHFGFPRHALTPHVKLPRSPTSLVRRQADGCPQVVHAESSTPFREERGSDGSDTCGNTFGGGDCDGDEGVCVTPSTVSWVGGEIWGGAGGGRTSCSPRLARDGGWGEEGGCDGDGGRWGEREGPACGGGGETTSRPRPASEGGWGGGENGGGGELVGGAETSWSPRSARDGGWGEEGGDGCGEEGGVWDGGQGAPYSPRNARAAAIAPDRRRHHQHHYHHHQDTTANGNAAHSTRHAAARTSTSSQNHLIEWKTQKGSGHGSGYRRRGIGSCSGSSGRLGGFSYSSSSVGGEGGTGGSGGNGGVVSFHRRNKRRTRGKPSPRSGDNSRHHQKSAFRETGASRRPAHQGDMAPAPSVARASPRVATGGGNFRGSDGGDDISVSGSGWRGDARYLPVAPSAARQVACTNSGWCGPDVHIQLPVAACRSFASKATTVGAATWYPRHAGHGVHAGYSRQTGHCGQGWYGGPAWHASRVGYANRVRR